MAATKPQLSGRDSATRSPSRAPIAAPARRRSAELRSASHAAPAVVAPTNGMYQRLYHLGALESRNTSKSARKGERSGRILRPNTKVRATIIGINAPATAAKVVRNPIPTATDTTRGPRSGERPVNNTARLDGRAKGKCVSLWF